MRSFEDWIVYVLGGFAAIGTAVVTNVTKRQDEHERKLTEYAASIAALSVSTVNTKESLERIESKLDRVIEREQGA